MPLIAVVGWGRWAKFWILLSDITSHEVDDFLRNIMIRGIEHGDPGIGLSILPQRDQDTKVKALSDPVLR